MFVVESVLPIAKKRGWEEVSYLSLLEIRRDWQIRVGGLSMKKNETEGEKRRYKMVIYEAGELTTDGPCLGGDDGLLTGMNLVFARSWA